MSTSSKKQPSAPTTPTPPLPPQIILDYQRPAFEQLLAVAKASLSINRSKLAIRPRTNMLIIGPSGTGKSFLARAVARELDLPSLTLNVSEWIPLGAYDRGSTHTWPVIVDFLRNQKTADGGVIFLDEVDKLSGTDSWAGYLRNEIFTFLDQQIPHGLTDDLGSKMEDDDIQQAKEVLENRIFIIGAGAFQSLWEHTIKPDVGFGAKPVMESKPNLARLAKMLPTELVNRFRSKIIVLPQLSEVDYRRMLEQAEPAIPQHLRAAFHRIGLERVGEAVKNRQGCRFIEEVLVDALVAERSLVNAPIQGPNP